VVHCFGASTFFMAMLAGLQGVRSVVCSQVATHVVAPFMTRLKAGLYLPELLDRFGTKSLTAYTDTRADASNRVFDKLLSLYPLPGEERCDSGVCHRITFLYSLLYEHDQLNPATHDVLHEMFGVSNISAFKHLARMVRKGKVVTADGKDAYVPHLDRLAVPITFIHGAENACYKPESTELTHKLLAKRNGRHLYERYVVQNYGHIDCIFGKNAARDVFPLMLKHLEAH
jgi:cholesterol oxidase